eukprot:GHRQ01039037.1.p3 GENE.GHRQ01039037.1~~GHRQ01039037.1.p3  ORF type:complete len:120 (-),score=27.41 GHRQ01039037.1:654-1013(-)
MFAVTVLHLSVLTLPCPLPHLLQGHAIECRINAEEPFQNFRPGPGRVTTYLAPGGPHVRMDSHLYPDYLVPPNYDSLLGKLIVWGEDRNQVTTTSRYTRLWLVALAAAVCSVTNVSERT